MKRELTILTAGVALAFLVAIFAPVSWWSLGLGLGGSAILIGLALWLQERRHDREWEHRYGKGRRRR